eukprot:TRINITY_DN4633_c0_g1_i3.p1 TRINITY_DN4633_c0_g1~~TRINITY_DN4633_c0_g1_i3.p1  ORF type:complete len:133 (-),score=58.38 TRINITY_DN4633_c0_g1_i3:109-507(-)
MCIRDRFKADVGDDKYFDDLEGAVVMDEKLNEVTVEKKDEKESEQRIDIKQMKPKFVSKKAKAAPPTPTEEAKAPENPPSSPPKGPTPQDSKPKAKPTRKIDDLLQEMSKPPEETGAPKKKVKESLLSFDEF